jgi:erythromycin esterase-like protein
MTFHTRYSTHHATHIDASTLAQLKQGVKAFSSIESAPFADLAHRIGKARIVLLGEATHGTSEFYRMRAELTKYLIQNHGFSFVALEADWPDAAQANRYVRHMRNSIAKAFTRFPVWMWRNEEFYQFLKWLRGYNGSLESKEQKVSLYGLDLYSLYSSIDEVLRYLDHRDPELAKVARENYSCLMPWKESPSEYGSTMLLDRYKDCEKEVLNVLNNMFEKQLDLHEENGEGFLDMFLNANLIVNSEKYYRTLYDAFSSSWNIRDQHMFETLEYLLSFKGEEAKTIVWAHNSHIGNAAATEMNLRKEFNLGQLCRENYKDNCYLIGFGTYQGTVAAATDWGGNVEIKNLLPAREDSYEYLFHKTEQAAFLLPLRQDQHKNIRDILFPQRLERAVGVIYRPETERFSHYFSAILPEQFDEYIWFETTKAVTPLQPQTPSTETPDTYPFGV